ncbi:MAG: cytochrome c [Ferruginibacter sp.]
MKIFVVIFAVFALMTVTISFIPVQEDPWKVPKMYESMKNPVIADISSINAGKDIYNSYCRSCHGKNGKGEGKRADNLSTKPSDFSSALFQKQTDGALLYKVYFGHKDMPGFKKRIPGNEDVMKSGFGQTRNAGDLINFLRTYAKK